MTERISIDELHSRFKAQGVSAREHVAVKCVMCGTVQSMASLAKAGCPADKVETHTGFSCEGRWSNAGPYPADPKKIAARTVRGCDWTLGGLFRIHKLEAIDAEGKSHPFFEPASAEEAQSLERLMTMAGAAC